MVGSSRSTTGAPLPRVTQGLAHAAKSPTTPTELWEATDVQRLVSRAASAAGGTDEGLAPMGVVNRATPRLGQGPFIALCLQRREARQDASRDVRTQ